MESTLIGILSFEKSKCPRQPWGPFSACHSQLAGSRKLKKVAFSDASGILEPDRLSLTLRSTQSVSTKWCEK